MNLLSATRYHRSVTAAAISAVVADLRAPRRGTRGRCWSAHVDSYRRCYVRGPDGITVEPAQQIS